MGRSFDDYTGFLTKITHPKHFCLQCIYQEMPGKIKENRGLEGNDYDRMNIVYGLKYDKCFSEPHGLCSKIRHMCQLLLQERRNEIF